MPRTVYIVFGTCGMWDEKETWPVAAFLNEQSAERHGRRAGRRARELVAEYDRVPYGANKFDPNMRTALNDKTLFYYTQETMLVDWPGTEEAKC